MCFRHGCEIPGAGTRTRFDTMVTMQPDDVATHTSPAKPRAHKKPLPLLDRGTCVGRYVILDSLGHGGMGIVYRAYDPDLDRQVALKLVRAVTDESTARMIREAKAMAKVSHPNIVGVFDVGTFGKSVFIALELVEGRTLKEWCRETKPSWRVLLAHLIEAGQGLAAAHAVGLVHLDFKPHNVIVGTDGRVRVLDFGVARLGSMPSTDASDSGPASRDDSSEEETAELGRDSDDATPTPLEVPRRASDPAVEPTPRSGVSGVTTLPQVVVTRLAGTPGYMPPEQRREGTLDARADQFAFAVTCCELLYGERPFVGDTIEEYQESSTREQFRPVPAGNETPAWLRRALLRALAAAPDDRYSSMNELLAALRADPARRRRTIAMVALGALVVTAASVAITMRSSSAPAPCEDAARHLAGVWDASVASRLDRSFGATGASFATVTAGKVRKALDGRANAWISMHREACRATRVSGEQSAALLDLRMSCLARRRDELRALVDQLTTSTDAQRVAASIEAVEHLPSVATCADRDALTAVVPPPDDPAQREAINTARTELATIGALLLTGQWPEARGRAERVQERARKIGWAPLIAEAGFLRGQVERHSGSSAAAEKALTEAVEAAARAHLDDVSAAAWSELAWVVGYEQERTVEGLALASAAEAIALRADASPFELAGVAHTRALIYSAKGDQDAALREAERSLALYNMSPQASELDKADVQNTIGLVRSAQGDYVAAEQVHRQVLERRRAVLGDVHPKVADSLDNLGVVRYHQGAFDEARRFYEQALAMRIAALGPDNRDVGTSHNNLGGLLMETGDEKGAAEHLEAALRIYEKALGPDHGDLAIPLSNLGELATRRGAFDEAITYCNRALGLDERASGPDDPKLGYDLVCIGEAQLGRNALRPAQVALERALHLREGSEGDLGELARTRFDLARVLWRLGAQARAKTLATMAHAGFAEAGEAWKRKVTEVRAWLEKPQ